ncbi:MAG: DEAD/DEAH box helicase [Bacteroidota bacterium]
MFTPFIAEHLHKVGRLKNTLLFYKGFPSSFISEVGKTIPRLYPGDYLTPEGVDVLRLDAQAKKLVGALLTLEDDAARWGVYEEFIALNNVLLDLSQEYEGKIVVIENNFFQKECPHQFPGLAADDLRAFMHYLEAESEDDREPDEPLATLAKYFGSVRQIKGDFYCSYVDKDEQNGKVAVEPFFTGYPLLTLEQIESTPAPPDGAPRYLFPDPTQEFRAFKAGLHFGRSLQPAHVVVESATFKDPGLLHELSILKLVADRNGLAFSLSLKRPTFVSSFRPEFRQILNRYWESAADFRELTFYEDPDTSLRQINVSQGALIEDIVEQAEKAQAGRQDFHDLFITAPTGSGKSVLFQIPAIYLAEREKLVTLVVTPLKALMFDQVHALKKRGVSFAAYLNSDQSLIEREETLRRIQNGEVSIAYLSPELLLSADLRTFVGERKVGLLVIDEAHLVTTWGRDFRVDYWYLGYYIDRLRRYGVSGIFPVLAMTATAVYQGPDDMVLETIISLNMQNPKIYLGKVRRDEITFDIRAFKPQGSYENQKMQKTLERIVESINAKRKTIVYFPWVRQIRDLMTMIDPKYLPRIGTYYGSQDSAEKEDLQLKFKNGEIFVMLATKAFGMGIDISDIEVVYHHAPSGNLCDYVQEVGRVARDKSISGVARTDFNSKDLKYARVLYGLSAIRQYQLSFMLKKLWDIFRINRKQNLLVSPDTFSFIFDAEDNLDQKVKSGLLLLEKDLIKKYGYPVLLVRPRSLFSKAYACVPSGIEQDFLAMYGSYVTKVSDCRQNLRRNGACTTTDLGDIYELDLRRIWEDHFSNLSFPELKRKFFERKLFSFAEDVFPRYRFRIELNDEADQTRLAFRSSLAMVESVFAELGGFFSKADLMRAIAARVDSTTLARRIANVLLNLFTVTHNWPELPSGAFPDGFIQKRVSGSEEQYRVINRTYLRIRRRLYRELDSLLGDCGGTKELLRYVGNGDRSNNYSFMVANLLEAFQQATYEILGGKDPEIFIRINDPYKIRMLVQQGDYNNLILQDIERRHKKSMELMDYFFTRPFSNADRWDLVEQYFLGREVMSK